MKKALIVSLIISAILLLCTGINYIGNEKMIKDYEHGKYKINSFDVLGFFEPYISPYNRGNIYYQRGNYDMAIEEYRSALTKFPAHNGLKEGDPYDRECKIRINLALALVANLYLEDLSEEDNDEAIEVLTEAIDILVEENCANRDEISGHNAEAQQLEIELTRILDSLQNPQSQDGSDDKQDKQNQDEQNQDDKNNENKNDDGSKDDDKDKQNQDGSTGQEDEKSDLEKKFEEQQKEVQQNRNQMYEDREIFKMDYDFNNEPSW